MVARSRWLPLALLLATAGCQDAAAPPSPTAPESAPLFSVNSGGDLDYLRIIQQASGAPRLETYQVSFWASHERASTVVVRYQPEAGQAQGDPFLVFVVPEKGLKRGAGGAAIAHKDSILITMTIDTVNFIVDFEPSGIRFDNKHPAILAIWYHNANPDLNRDGVVDAVDAALRQQLAIVYQQAKKAPWWRHWSWNDTGLEYVLGPVYHFSSYAVSW